MHLTVEAQRLAARYLQRGAVAIDATAGNGFDTVFLAKHVGAEGRVIAIDLQVSAIERVRRRVEQEQLLDRVHLVADDHANLKQIVAPKLWGEVACVMFNLGYLPFSDKSVITSKESTMAGVQGAVEVLRPGGLLSILAYVGHPGGRDEANAMAQWMDEHASRFQSTILRDASNPNSPILWSLEKKA
jgi:predicted methyltransferase